VTANFDPDPGAPLLDVAAVSDTGTERDGNEDACGVHVDAPDCAIAAVADGVSSSPAGEVASATAIEVLLRAFCDEPPTAAAGQRLYRATQQANIEVYDRALAVPELRGMATTLTAIAVQRGELTAVHVGDSRLYLVRRGAIAQLTKDHTAAAEKVRYHLLSRERARGHPDRSVLTRSLGRELIVSRDRISQRLESGDLLVLCTDGLYNVLEDEEIARLAGGLDAPEGARALVAAANARGTPDNVTAAVLRMSGPVADGAAAPAGLAARLRRALSRGR
jgi:protein phosphatase